MLKFRSKGEEFIYTTYLSQHLVSPNIQIIQEASLKQLGCMKALRADFLINYNNKLLGIVEVNGEQHRKNNEYLTSNDIIKKEFCEDNNIDYIWCDYKWNCIPNFSNWYYENSYWLGMELQEDYYEGWWHSTCFQHVLWLYNNGHNLMDVKNGLSFLY